MYSGVTYAGYVGLITGMKPKGFSMTLDERGMLCQQILFIKWNRVGCRVFKGFHTMKHTHSIENTLLMVLCYRSRGVVGELRHRSTGQTSHAHQFLDARCQYNSSQTMIYLTILANLRNFHAGLWKGRNY